MLCFPPPADPGFLAETGPEKYFENHPADGVRNLPPPASKSTLFDEELVSSATPARTVTNRATGSIGEFRF